MGHPNLKRGLRASKLSQEWIVFLLTIAVPRFWGLSLISLRPGHASAGYGLPPYFPNLMRVGGISRHSSLL